MQVFAFGAYVRPSATFSPMPTDVVTAGTAGDTTGATRPTVDELEDCEGGGGEVGTGPSSQQLYLSGDSLEFSPTAQSKVLPLPEAMISLDSLLLRALTTRNQLERVDIVVEDLRDKVSSEKIYTHGTTSSFFF